MTLFTILSTDESDYCALQIEVNNCLYSILLSHTDLQRLKAEIRNYENGEYKGENND